MTIFGTLVALYFALWIVMTLLLAQAAYLFMRDEM